MCVPGDCGDPLPTTGQPKDAQRDYTGSAVNLLPSVPSFKVDLSIRVSFERRGLSGICVCFLAAILSSRVSSDRWLNARAA